MVQFLCTRCGMRLELPADQAGQRIQCLNCGEMGVVSAAGGAAPPPAARGPASPAGPPAAQPPAPMPPPLPRSMYPRRAVRRPVPQGTNVAAVISLVLGILCVAILLFVIFVGITRLLLLAEFACAGIGGIVAVMALQQARRTRSGKGLALAGLILCLVPMVPTAALGIFGFLQCGAAQLQ